MEIQPDFKIIVIDDNPEIHKDFLKVLTKNSGHVSNEFDDLDKKIFGSEQASDNKIHFPLFQIDTAMQGEEGVRRIQEAILAGSPYALAFVDIRMPPGWDGIETIKHIWELDKNIQIVICTAYSDYSWEETINELGQTDNLLILKKPFDQIAVRQLACALTRKWGLMQESRSYVQSLEESVQERTLLLQESLSERANLRTELEWQATHDILTGLPNRVLLAEKVQKAISAAKLKKSKLAILFFDLDRFKLINDSLNHAAGDDLLKTIATRIQAMIPTHGTFSRLGGDEFIILLTELPNREWINQFSSEILKKIAEPVMLDHRELSISGSIGISLYPTDGKTYDDLLRNANAAMYYAKKSGTNQFQFYTEEMNSKNIKRLELESELRKAIEHNEFVLYYQPQITFNSNSLSVVEALIRWNHPNKGIILPIDFIPVTEETGLIISINEWMVYEACRQNKQWQKENLSVIRLSVKIHSVYFNQPNFVNNIKSILLKTELNPKYLELVFSENALIDNVDSNKIVKQLKELGVVISLSDFGINYANLNYLENFRLDRLKMDPTFLQNIEVNHGGDVIMSAIIALAKKLNLEVITEGGDTHDQTKSSKYGEIQQLYFSEPFNAEDFEMALKDKNIIDKILKSANKSTTN